MVRFSTDLFHLMCFDETKQKVNHKIFVRGQANVTRGQKVILIKIATCFTNKDPGPPNLIKRIIDPCFIKFVQGKGSKVTQRSLEVIEVYRAKTLNNVRCWSGLLHLMWIDETRNKVNHMYRVKGKKKGPEISKCPISLQSLEMLHRTTERGQYNHWTLAS